MSFSAVIHIVPASGASSDDTLDLRGDPVSLSPAAVLDLMERAIGKAFISSTPATIVRNADGTNTITITTAAGTVTIQNLSCTNQAAADATAEWNRSVDQAWPARDRWAR